MTGTLAQLIALTAYGNHYLKNGEIPDDFDSGNSVFQFCNTVDFRIFMKKYFFSKRKEEVLTDSPMKWFRFLKNNGCNKLRLYYQSSTDQKLAEDHKLAGFVGGGGTWLIETVYDTYSNFWANRWEVTDRESAESKIWSVNYGMVLEKAETVDLHIDLQSMKQKLDGTLTEIADFAFAQKQNNWSEIFEKAKKILHSETPESNYYHDDMIPLENYDLTTKQLMFAAGSAWVFGGMGSWNDIGFDSQEDNERYEKLSAQLYSNINEAILAATNAY